MRTLATGLVLGGLAVLAGAGAAGGSGGFTITETADEVRLVSPELEAAIRKRGYVSGVAGGSFVDRKTGFRDAGFGLDIVDWLMEPGSDRAYRALLPGDLAYDTGNAYHGNTPKRGIEGPQICTQAKQVFPEVIRGRDFTAVKLRHRYHLAAPGKRTGSEWEQTLVFPAGKRYFLSSDRILPVNDSDNLFLRIDMPGHIRHNRGDTFTEVYLSYRAEPRVPASEFFADFAPDAKYNYRRERDGVPRRFIRAYRLRDPKTGAAGPWLAGMTLDPGVVSEAWCHQRGYVCMIEEFWGRRVRAGDPFSAAFLVGYFDSIEEMEQTYDRYAGHLGLEADAAGWRLTKGPSARPAEDAEAARVARKLEEFQDRKFGFFVHWGIYSQWGCIESWPLVEVDTWARPDDLPAWTERGKDMERFRRDYRALNRTFRPRRFSPQAWVAAARAAGMRYFVFTTKHHDGFSMWDTRQTDYRITHPDTPFSRSEGPDVTRRLFDAFRRAGFGIGAYFSKADWNHPDYWSPDAPAPTRNPNYDTLTHPHRWRRFVDFTHRQIEELTRDYGPLDILWLDAGQVRPPRQDLRMDRLAGLARGHQPGLIIVDRTVGGRYEDYRTPEQEVPHEPLPYVWETCMTLGDQWSYRPNDRYKPTRTLIHLLADIVAKGGNFLLNVGPDGDGELPPIAVQRMREMGDWLKVNGEAIYGTRVVRPYKEGRLAFTQKAGHVYALYLAPEGTEAPPAEIRLKGQAPRPGSEVRMLGVARPLTWRREGAETVVRVPEAVRAAPPCSHAWVLKLRPAH